MRSIFAVPVSTFVLAVAMATQACAAIWTEYASDPVYSPGKAYYPTILKEGSTYTMWSDSASGLQMATSTNGINWTTQGTSSGLTSSSHSLVEKIGSTYRIWYMSGSLNYSINNLHTATSTDGLTWTNDQVLTQNAGNTVISATSTNWNGGSYGPADVIYNAAGSDTLVLPVDEASVWANKYVMYYDGTTGSTESLGLAVSNDGINWVGYNGGAAAIFTGDGTGWDSGYVSRATVIRVSDDLYEMYYSGGVDRMDYGIGYATSTDGINWTRDDDAIFSKYDGVAWRDKRTYTPMVIGDEMWFTGVSTATGKYAIGYATSENSTSDVVPEPSTLVIWSVFGCVGLVAGRCRRKKNA